MKNITKKSIEEDLAIVGDLMTKYSDAIWENQEAQPAHFDNQLKLVRISMGDARLGLQVAARALSILSNIDVIEDEPAKTEESERYCTITKEEWESHREYTCMPEGANDEYCKGCKWYKVI